MNPTTVEDALKMTEVWEQDDCLQIGAKVARTLAKEVEKLRLIRDEAIAEYYNIADMCKDCE